MKQYKFSLKDECMKELPSMEEPKKLYGYESWQAPVIGSFICSYCGYHSSTALHAMEHDCIYDDYKKHLASLQSIPVPKEYLNQFEDDKVYNEDEFEIKNMPNGAVYLNGEDILRPSAIPTQTVEYIELWDEVYDRICDILYKSNGSSVGASFIISELRKNYTITRK